MNTVVVCDHAGYQHKNKIVEFVKSLGHVVVDLGTNSEEPVDYPDYVEQAAKIIQKKEAERGIFLCGSGIGACIAANKMRGIYAGVCHDTYSAHQGVEHDAMNVLCLGTRIIGIELMYEIIKSFLSAHFIGGEPGEERHSRRVEKIKSIERANLT